MTDNHKDSATTHGNIGRLVQIGKVEGSVTIQDTLESYACCPVCGRNDEVKKVSAILAKETHTTILAMKLKAPAQPQAKRKPSWAWWLLIGYIILAGGEAVGTGIYYFIYAISFVLGFRHYDHVFGEGLVEIVWTPVQIITSMAGSIGLCIIGLLLFLWSRSIYRKYKKKGEIYDQEVKIVKEQKYPKWQKAIVRWEKLYYCSRNDCVFIPGENTYAELGSINEYVYHIV